MAYILGQLEGIAGLSARRQMPWGTGQSFPHIALTWDEGTMGVAYREFAARLLAGKPRTSVQVVDPRGRPSASVPEIQVRVHVHTLQEGEEIVVAQRLRALLTEKR